MRIALPVVMLFSLVMTVAFGLLIGKDLSWDVANHHLYLPFAWVNGRIDGDLFGAGPQVYQNPLGYLPFYFMVMQGFPAWLVGVVLAALHAVNAVLLWLLANRLWRGQAWSQGWGGLATLLAWMAPVFLQSIASSSIDSLSSIFVLGALLCLVSTTADRIDLRICLLAGLLLGLSFSIKQSNAVFVLAIGLMLIWQWASRRRSFSALLVCGFGLLVGLLLGMGWYSWVLWERFGNPIFPLFNNIFQSPYAPTSAVLAQRFLPTGWEWLTRVGELAQLKRLVYFEGFLPDLRPLLLLIVGGVGLILVWLGKALKTSRLSGQACWTTSDGDLLVFAGSSYILWLVTSANGRYAIPLLMLVGVLLVRWAAIGLPLAVARGSVLLIGVLQLFFTVTAADLRFLAEPWDAQPYFKVNVSERLKTVPVLHLTIGIQTHASLAVFFNPDGALINPIGQMSLPMTGPVGEELKQRLAQWEGRTRILFPAIPGIEKIEKEKLAKIRLDDMLYRLGLRVDLSDCELLRFHLGSVSPGSFFAKIHAKNMFIGEGREQSLMSCKVVSGVEARPEFERERAQADKIFDVLERACPKIYGPPGLTTERGPKDWRRFYANSDASVLVSSVDVITQHTRSPIDRVLGAPEEILAGRGNLDCRMWSLVTPD